MRSHQELWSGREIKTWMRNAKLIANLQHFPNLEALKAYVDERRSEKDFNFTGIGPSTLETLALAPAEAWEKQKRLRAFAAQQRQPQPAQPTDENQISRRDGQRDSLKQRQPSRVRQKPRQTLRF